MTRIEVEKSKAVSIKGREAEMGEMDVDIFIRRPQEEATSSGNCPVPWL